MLQVVGDCLLQKDEKLEYLTEELLANEDGLKGEFSGMRHSLSHANFLSHKDKLTTVTEEDYQVIQLDLQKLCVIVGKARDLERITIEQQFLDQLINEKDDKQIQKRLKTIVVKKEPLFDHSYLEPLQTTSRRMNLNCQPSEIPHKLISNTTATMCLENLYNPMQKGEFDIFSMVESLNEDLSLDETEKKLKSMKTALQIAPYIQNGTYLHLISGNLKVFLEFIPKQWRHEFFNNEAQLLVYNEFSAVTSKVNLSEDEVIDHVLEFIEAALEEADVRERWRKTISRLKRLKTVFEMKNDRKLVELSVDHQAFAKYDGPLQFIIRSIQGNKSMPIIALKFLDLIRFEIKEEIKEKLKINYKKRLVDSFTTRTAQIRDLEHKESLNKIESLAAEMLYLECYEIMELMGVKMQKHQIYLDLTFPAVIGKNLRNYIAHGDIYLEMCLNGQLSMVLRSHNQFLLSLNLDQTLQFGFQCPENLNKILQEFDQQRKWILYDNRNSIFNEDSKPGNFLSRDIHGLTHVHYLLTNPATNYSFLNHLINKFSLDESCENKSVFDRIFSGDYRAHNYERQIIQDYNKTTVNVLIDNLISSTDNSSQRFILCQILCCLTLPCPGFVNCVFKLLFDGNSNTSGFEDNLLYLACLYNNIEAVIYLISNTFYKNNIDELIQGATALQIAIKLCHHEVARFLLQNGAKVNMYKKDSNKSGDLGPPVCIAARNGDLKMLEILHSYKCNFEELDAKFQSALHLSILYNHDLEVCKFLLEHCPNLIHSIPSNILTMIKVFHDFSLSLDVTQLDDCEPEKIVRNILYDPESEEHQLFVDSRTGISSFMDMATLQLSRAEECNDKVFDRTIGSLIHALMKANPEKRASMIDSLLEIGAKIIRNGESLMDLACMLGRKDIVDLLLKNGADVNRSGPLLGPIQCACCLKRGPEFIRFLFQNGARLNIDTKILSPLNVACFVGDLPTVKVMLELGADPCYKSPHEESPLRSAILADSPEIVDELVRKGAKIEDHEVLLGLMKKPQILSYLIASNPDISLAILEFAIVKCDEAAVKIVLEHMSQRSLAITINMMRIAMHSRAMRIFYLLINYAHLQCNDKELAELFMAGINNYNTEVLRSLVIDKNADVNLKFPDCDNQTYLHFACANQNEEKAIHLVEFLLQNGANVNAMDDRKYTPIIFAVQRGYDRIVKLLLEAKANINILGNSEVLALDQAIFFKYRKLIKLFLDHPLQSHQEDTWIDTDDLSWCRKLYKGVLDESFSDLQCLLEMDGSLRINHKFEQLSNYTSLHIACLEEDHEKSAKMIQFLVENGADSNAITDLHLTPLHIASVLRNAKAIELLLASNADTNLKTKGRPKHAKALELAMLNGNFEVVKLLSKSLADNSLCLYLAVLYNQPKMIEHFLDNECLPKAFLEAFTRNEEDLMTALLSIGADINYKYSNTEDCTVLHMACFVDEEEKAICLAKFLIKNGAKINATNSKNWTPLYYACGRGLDRLVQVLLEHKADPTIRSTSITHLDAIDLTIQQGHLKVIKLLYPFYKKSHRYVVIATYFKQPAIAAYFRECNENDDISDIPDIGNASSRA